MESSRKVNDLLGWDSKAIASVLIHYLMENKKKKMTKLAKELYMALFKRGALLQVNGTLYEPISTYQRNSPQGGCRACALVSQCAAIQLAELCINIDITGFEKTDKPGEPISTIFKLYEGVLPPKKTVLIADLL